MSKINGFFLACLVTGTASINTGCSESKAPEHTPENVSQPKADVEAAPQQVTPSIATTPNSPPAAKPQTETPSVATRDEPQETQPAKPATSQTKLPPIPKFKDFAAGTPRKEAFFKFMAPLIKQANAKVLEKRQRLQSLIKNDSLSKNDQAWLNQQAEAYGLDGFDPSNKNDLTALLTKIDAIPAALALAQGANESAWGTSRFARQANNYFGQWCFSKGCGLVPKQRNDGAIHEVRAFDHPYESVVSYIHNLNSHRTYEKLREIRAKTRQKGKSPTGLEMAEGLVNYSARKHEYVKELQSMIRYNKLTKYN